MAFSGKAFFDRQVYPKFQSTFGFLVKFWDYGEQSNPEKSRKTEKKPVSEEVRRKKPENGKKPKNGQKPIKNSLFCTFCQMRFREHLGFYFHSKVHLEQIDIRKLENFRCTAKHRNTTLGILSVSPESDIPPLYARRCIEHRIFGKIWP